MGVAVGTLALAVVAALVAVHEARLRRAGEAAQARLITVRSGTAELVPHQATFALFTTSRRRSSWACLFRQMM
jgi:hypothetical protein